MLGAAGEKGEGRGVSFLADVPCLAAIAATGRAKGEGKKKEKGD